MEHLYRKCALGISVLFICLIYHTGNAQTVPNLSIALEWDQWYLVNSVEEIENQFNAGRRHEEINRNLTPGILGDLHLHPDFLSFNFAEQALILLNAERTARDGVNYGSTTYTVTPLEGAENTLCSVAQGHADDMQENNFFSHTGTDGKNSFMRITDAFPDCTESTSENLAWNSIGGSGFIAAIPLAIYNFIYDDACCGWGHRTTCLKMSLTTNNYQGTSRFGMVGFGRATGANGDFFVMDFFDPEPQSSSCNYDLIDFNSGGSGTCPDLLDLTGMITSGTYQAITVNSSGMVPANNQVDLIGSDDVNLNSDFEVQLGSELTIEIQNCSSSVNRITESHAGWESENPVAVRTEPEFRRSQEAR